jgi:starch-binding outer membrane protein, SusD/RagB family
MKARTIPLLYGLAVLCACGNPLDVRPKTFSGTGDYYRTPDQVERAVNGAYSFLQILYGTGSSSYWAMTEMRSDNTTYQYNDADRGEQEMESLDEFLITADNYVVEQVWRDSYRAILQSNTILDRIGGVAFSDQSRKDRYVGEAEFLRAFHYFNLVRLCGDVPLLLHEVTSPGAASAGKRASVDEVYQQIVSDLADAIAKLPDRYPAADVGRATRGAAKMLLTDVYMTRRNYQAAAAELADLLTMGYSLLPSYAAVFDPMNKNNAESIFEVQFSAAIEGEASEFIYRFAPFNSGNAIVGFNDLVPSHAGYNIPTRDLLRAFEVGDRRRDAAIGFYVAADNSAYDVAIGDTIPYVKKYAHPFQQQRRTDDNFPVYRYAEALLLQAEALNELGRTGEAYAYVDQVRGRAGLAPLPGGLSQDQFRDAVWHEERVELAFENKRWYQLVRTDRAVAVMRLHGEEMKQLMPRLSSAAYQVQPYMLRYPIPAREVRLNGFAQNPEW